MQAAPLLGAAAAAGVVYNWRLKRSSSVQAESYWKPGFVPRSPSAPHEPLGRPLADGEKFAVSELGYVATRVDGWIYPPFPNALGRVTDHRANFRLRGGQDGDIVVATYPKCGTTWVQQILLLLQVDGDANKIKNWFQGDSTPSPWIEMIFATSEQGNKWDAPKPFRRRILKTHSSALESPWTGAVTAGGIPEGAKVVIPTRNPCDAAVSMYWHVCPKGHQHGTFNYLGSMSHFVAELYTQGNVESGCFWAWHASWWRAAQTLPKDRVLFIPYEDMKADLPAAVRKIAEFCDLPCDEALVQRVVMASDFGAMKDQFNKQNEERKAKGLRVKEDHIREGSSGGWRRALTPEIGGLVQEAHKRRCAEEGLPEEFFGPF